MLGFNAAVLLNTVTQTGKEIKVRAFSPSIRAHIFLQSALAAPCARPAARSFCFLYRRHERSSRHHCRRCGSDAACAGATHIPPTSGNAVRPDRCSSNPESVQRLPSTELHAIQGGSRGGARSDCHQLSRAPSNLAYHPRLRCSRMWESSGCPRRLGHHSRRTVDRLAARRCSSISVCGI